MSPDSRDRVRDGGSADVEPGEKRRPAAALGSEPIFWTGFDPKRAAVSHGEGPLGANSGHSLGGGRNSTPREPPKLAMAPRRRRRLDRSQHIDEQLLAGHENPRKGTDQVGDDVDRGRYAE